LKDFLAYQFPGTETKIFSGELEEIQPKEDTEGFIFSNFEGSNVYCFTKEKELSTISEFHVLSDVPYVYSTREYILQAHSFLNGMSQLNIDKAVFSRIKKVTFPIQKAFLLFESLKNNYPKCCVYLLSSKRFGTWIGASPEILAEVHFNQFFTISLAGTKKTNSIDLWGEKEKLEQSLVTNYIEQTLVEAQCTRLDIQGPYDYSAGPVTHLRTDISAEISSGSVWSIVNKLHPTPAVSGFPKHTALELINSVEAHDRMLYTGMFGILGKEHTKLFVNLRCAQLQNENAYLYLGGGFTSESIPELELDETENKSKTILRCMDEIKTK
jgi:isochorismate synthase